MILNIPDLVCKPLYTYFHQMFKTAHLSEIPLHILAQKARFLATVFVSYTKSSQKTLMIFLLQPVYTELWKILFSFPISSSQLSTAVALHILACPQRGIMCLHRIFFLSHCHLKHIKHIRIQVQTDNTPQKSKTAIFYIKMVKSQDWHGWKLQLDLFR